jgi:GT2 family glycosyltransferase
MDKQPTENNFFEELMVILVLYKIEIKESPAFISLTVALQTVGQKTTIFIYDNSPKSHGYELNDNWIILYRHDPNNPGVSKAYNEGFRCAKAQSKNWMLLVDQDTQFPQETFSKYWYTLKKYNSSVNVPVLFSSDRIVSPLKFYRGGGRTISIQPGKELKLGEFYFHNSGLLISVEAFENAECYDENLQLDFSDLSFVCKLRQNHINFRVVDFSCQHQLATLSSSDIKAKLLRFSTYLKAARYFKKKYRPSDRWLIPRLFLRAVKLSMQHQSFQFLVLYFRQV